jgi:hypothetical protein
MYSSTGYGPVRTAATRDGVLRKAMSASAQEGVKQLQQQWGVAAPVGITDPTQQLRALASQIITEKLAARLAAKTSQSYFKVLYLDIETNGRGKLGIESGLRRFAGEVKCA